MTQKNNLVFSCPNPFFGSFLERRGVTLDGFRWLLDQQNGACACCRSPYRTADNYTPRFCEKTGWSLVCWNCNYDIREMIRALQIEEQDMHSYMRKFLNRPFVEIPEHLRLEASSKPNEWKTEKWEVEKSPNDSRNERIPKPRGIGWRRHRVTEERLAKAHMAKQSREEELRLEAKLSSMGLTLAQCRWLQDEQKGLCACCSDRRDEQLQVDCIQAPTRVFGMLCFGCLARVRKARKNLKAGLPWKPARPDATTAKVEEYLKRKPPIIPLIS